MSEQVNKFLDDTLIVLVLYKIPLAQSSSWISLLTSIDYPFTIFIYDNSPESQNSPATIHNVIYYHDSDNSGVARAYNAAFKQCQKLGKHWLLLLDQDTTITKYLIPTYVNSLSAFPKQKYFVPIIEDSRGILSPFIYQVGISKRVKHLDAGIQSFSTMRAANNGTLIHSSAFSLVNGYDLELPIDFSDIYFQEKLIPSISTFVVVPERIHQEFSGTEFKDRQQSQIRFQLFCQACITMSSKTGNKFNFYRLSLKRALHLSFRFGTPKFIFLQLKIWLQ